MADNKKKIKIFRPNIMWFWAAITILIVAYSIFGGDEAEPVKSDWSHVEQMVDCSIEFCRFFS